MSKFHLYIRIPEILKILFFYILKLKNKDLKALS